MIELVANPEQISTEQISWMAERHQRRAAALAAAEYRATQSAKDAVTMSALPEGVNTQSSVFSESTVEAQVQVGDAVRSAEQDANEQSIIKAERRERRAAALAAAEYRNAKRKDAVTMSALPEGLNTQSSVFLNSVEAQVQG